MKSSFQLAAGLFFSSVTSHKLWLITYWSQAVSVWYLKEFRIFGVFIKDRILKFALDLIVPIDSTFLSWILTLSSKDQNTWVHFGTHDCAVTISTMFKVSRLTPSLGVHREPGNDFAVFGFFYLTSEQDWNDLLIFKNQDNMMITQKKFWEWSKMKMRSWSNPFEIIIGSRSP